jgi:hypothetical protein
MEFMGSLADSPPHCERRALDDARVVAARAAGVLFVDVPNSVDRTVDIGAV